MKTDSFYAADDVLKLQFDDSDVKTIKKVCKKFVTRFTLFGHKPDVKTHYVEMRGAWPKKDIFQIEMVTCDGRHAFIEAGDDEKRSTVWVLHYWRKHKDGDEIFYVLAKFHNSLDEPFTLKQLIVNYRGTEDTKESERKHWEEKFTEALS